MGLGVLKELPIYCPMFFSACSTADVPRSSVAFVLVHVVSATQSGALDDAKARVLGFLIDGNQALNTIRPMIVRFLAFSRLPGETPSQLNQLRTYTRVNGALLPVSFDSNTSVFHNLVSGTGRLFRALRMETALSVYERSVTTKSNLCSFTAKLVLKEHLQATPPARRSAFDKQMANFYSRGLQKFTQEQATQIPPPLACSRRDCDCFLRRAVHRAGATYIELFAAVPSGPVRNDWPQVASRVADSLWERRVATTSAQPDPFLVWSPSAWPVTLDHLQYRITSFCTSFGFAAEAESEATLLSESEVDDEASLKPLGMCTRWFLRQPRAVPRLREMCQSLQSYHEPQVMLALAHAGQHTFRRLAYDAAEELEVSVHELYFAFVQDSKRDVKCAFFNMLNQVFRDDETPNDCRRNGLRAVVLFAFFETVDAASQSRVHASPEPVTLYNVWASLPFSLSFAT